MSYKNKKGNFGFLSYFYAQIQQNNNKSLQKSPIIFVFACSVNSKICLSCF